MPPAQTTKDGFEYECKSGFMRDGVDCYDADECMLGNHDCGKNAQCIDCAGTYSCECLAGYIGDCVICSNVKECDASMLPCDNLSVCHDTLGSFNCNCKPSFEMDSNRNCVDMNECLHASGNNCNDVATCLKTLDSYSCTCNSGYLGDGVICKDVCR